MQKKKKKKSDGVKLTHDTYSINEQKRGELELFIFEPTIRRIEKKEEKRQSVGVRNEKARFRELQQ